MIFLNQQQEFSYDGSSRHGSVAELKLLLLLVRLCGWPRSAVVISDLHG